MPKSLSAVFVLFLFSLFSQSHKTLANSLTLQDFLAKPGLISANISPNGKHVATVWNLEDQRTVMIYDLDENQVVNKFGDNIIRPYYASWANDERLLVKLLVPYKTSQVRRDARTKDDFDIDDYFMFGRIVSTDILGDSLVELMNDERSAKRNVNLARIPHYLPNDKAHILMSSIRNERLSLFKVNVNTGQSDLVVTAGKFTIAFINDDNGKVLFRYDYKPIAKLLEIFEYTDEKDWNLVDEFYFDEDDESKNKIELEDLVGLYEGKLVYRKLNDESGYHELLTLNEGKQEVLVSVPNKDIVGVLTKGINNEVIGYRTLTDIYRSHYFDKTRQAKYDAAAKHFEGENFYFSNISENGERAVIKSFGPNNPVTYFTYEMTTDTMTPLSYSFASLPKEKLATGLKIQYLARDKTLINSYILLPNEFDGSIAMPLIVMPHGGPQARDFLGYDDFAQFIATRGYIVVQPNFRGSTGYGKKFEEAGYKEWGGKMQEDLEDLVTFLVSEGLVDKKRVCIIGGSYGGYAALMGPVKTPDMYQCSVSINGVTHLPDQVEFDLDKFESARLQTYIKDSIGDPATDMAMLKARSPALHADKITIPVLLIHGDEDEVVPYDQSEMMFDALEDQGKWVRMITLKETGHSAFKYKQDIEDIYTEVESFLAEFLPTNKQLKEKNQSTQSP
ncbi:S9 family peptidase [Aliiglaciecola sp. LCG003]|uniref:alpha/beta hydrolase family protein n=1 Tax=Aliiglaciecola sp. LCG003 TaxID=3053655 RepID=UPI002573FF99|nr:S9 family peptidase [Aliiglaciecola sp. LCG003]WJG09182.1 S9 family peptidase [Aliiglaciecola sp. LCG003]